MAREPELLWHLPVYFWRQYKDPEVGELWGLSTGRGSSTMLGSLVLL